MTFYDEDQDPHEGYVHETHAEQMFLAGLQAMREHVARELNPKHFHESNLVRSIWNPAWGPDPGQLDTIPQNAWDI